jgi:hypothetical protein
MDIVNAARTAAALAGLAALCAGLALAGCGTSPPGPAVPASAVPRLTTLAENAAKRNGDATPTQVTVVLTTHAKALTSATPGDTVPGTGRIRVYLITMQGHFVANDVSVPAGAAAPRGRYISVVVDARTLGTLDFGIGPHPPPVAPASLGPVTYLHLAGNGAQQRSWTRSRHSS